MSLKPIDHYSITAPGSIYDEEAMTALELAGRTAQKVNEVVLEVNAHEERTADEIKKMNDKTIPDNVAAEVDRHINNGEFGEAIDKYTGGLVSQVNNLLGNIAPGSTTSSMDAEIIDARLTSDNVAYPTIGEAFRAADTVNQIRMNGASSFTYERAPDNYSLGRRDGYYDKYGNFTASDSVECHEYTVKPGEVYIYDIVYGWDVVDAVLFDADGNFIQYFNESPKGARHINKTFPIVIPNGAAKLCVNSHPLKTIDGVHYFGKAYRVTGAKMNDGEIIDYIDKRFSMLDMSPILGEDVPGEVDHKYFLYGETGAITPTDSTIYYLKTCTVTPGALIYVEGSASYKNYVYAFYGKGDLITGLRNTENDNQLVFAGVVRVPDNVEEVIVASEKSIEPVVRYIDRFTPGGKEFTGLKWCVIGDSLTEHNTRALKNYHDYIAEKTGITVINLGVSGAGYKNGEDENKAFYQLVDSIPDDVDCITVFGGGNDMAYTLGTMTDTGTDTVCGCFNTLLDRIYERFPLIPLGIITPTPWKDHTPDMISDALYKLATRINQHCVNRGIPNLHLFRTSGLRPSDETFRGLAYSRDNDAGVHPDENGHKMIAPQIYAFLQSLIGTY